MTTLSLPERPKLVRHARLRWDAPSGKHLLVYPERGLLLNEVAARIVQLSDGTRTLSELIAALGAEFPMAPAARIEEETREFLTSLQGRGLLVREDHGPPALHADRRADVSVPAALPVLLEPGRARQAP